MKHSSQEYRTAAIMTRLYCRAHHGRGGELCADCEELLNYAEERIKNCPFGAEKPVCSKCNVHCYRPDMRGRISEVMRYSGPRMLFRHPVLALRHLRRKFQQCSSVTAPSE